MSLVTRCPACATTFRVSPAQLSARGGRVRCGKCDAVFDGVSNLLPDEAVAPIPNTASTTLDAHPAASESNSPPPAGDSGRQDPPAPAPLPEPPIDAPPTKAASGTKPEPAGETHDEAKLPEKRKSKRPRESNKRIDAAPIPAFLKPTRGKSTHPLAWAFLGLVALFFLALQAALHFRTELAILLPGARPHLETICDILGCDLRLPRRADLMSIESSDLQADSQRSGVIVLNALLRNRAPFTQEYPDLELTLTDQGDRAVIRRVLRPSDYLQEKRAAQSRGLPGGAEEPVRIRLETGGPAATGYQLFLFYSCPPPPASAFWQLSYPSRCQNSRS